VGTFIWVHSKCTHFFVPKLFLRLFFEIFKRKKCLAKFSNGLIHFLDPKKNRLNLLIEWVYYWFCGVWEFESRKCALPGNVHFPEMCTPCFTFPRTLDKLTASKKLYLSETALHFRRPSIN